MQVHTTDLEGVLLLEPKVWRDDRGFFLETWHAERYREAGIDLPFVQDNHSRSGRGILRGLHLQLEHTQGKLIRVIEGSIYDVAVDVRVGSPQFGKFVGVTLSAENFHQLWVPPGMAHGFVVTSEMAQVEYKCTDLYHPSSELSVAWNDPEIGIPWPIDDPTLSQKDAGALPLAELKDRLPRYTAR